ncbi:MAG: lysophospholipid acyltransferase family protein, partial [Pseudomonadota bacterium]
PVAVIYRPLDNAILENLITWVRQSTGNNALSKDLAMRPMLRILKQNGIVGLLIDQNTGHWEGVFVDYFGMPACTTNGLALLALHTDAPVIPTFMVRQKDGRYRLIIGEEVDIIRTGDREQDVLANTGRFTAIIEEMVRQYPDHWLWIHQRWKEKEPAKTEIL